MDPVEEEVTFDGSVRSVYLESCRKNNVIPASYFLRHMLDPDVAMRHHGLGPEGIKPLSVALVVSGLKCTKFVDINTMYIIINSNMY